MSMRNYRVGFASFQQAAFMRLLALILFSFTFGSLARGAEPRQVSGVLVQFNDGTQQQVGSPAPANPSVATQPATAPTATAGPAQAGPLLAFPSGAAMTSCGRRVSREGGSVPTPAPSTP